MAAILSYKANNQVGPKVGYFVDWTADKLTTLLTYLDEKNTLLKEQIQKDFEQKIDEYMPEKNRFLEESLAQINNAFSMIIDEKDDKEKSQLVSDLHRVDARVCWYLEKFSEVGISFENENTLSRNVAMLCELDPEMEPWLQGKLMSLVNASTLGSI